jgi:hypothetical protein
MPAFHFPHPKISASNVQVQEYRDEFDNAVVPKMNEWPFAAKVSDLLRATVVCASGDDVYEAWQRISAPEGFDVREGHGRMSK